MAALEHRVGTYLDPALPLTQDLLGAIRALREARETAFRDHLCIGGPGRPCTGCIKNARLDSLRAEVELRKRIIDRLPLCPDHRDTVRDCCVTCELDFVRRETTRTLDYVLRCCQEWLGAHPMPAEAGAPLADLTHQEFLAIQTRADRARRRLANRGGRMPRFVIRLSGPAAIPTFYARDEGGHYAASIETHALHYRTREAAERVNLAHRLHGVIQPCSCRPLRPGVRHADRPAL